MLEAGDFNKLFRDCMPLFIALGDEVRLSIIGVLEMCIRDRIHPAVLHLLLAVRHSRYG